MIEEQATWAIVELMGHVRIAGRLTEEEKFGSKLGRLDIPAKDGSFVTQMFGGGSVYRITIVTEAVARDVAAKTQPAPVSPWDYPKQLPAPTQDVVFQEPIHDSHEDDYEDEDDEDHTSPLNDLHFDP